MDSQSDLNIETAGENLGPIVVAVDVGLTCTGVALGSVRNLDDISTITMWPGRAWSTDARPKVPTALLYRGNNTRVQTWGLECEKPAPGMVLVNHFKLYLDQENLERTFPRIEDAPGRHEDIRRYFREFLRQLYGHIKREVSEKFKLSNWDEALVYFAFSVPTLWDNSNVAKEFKTIAEEAGFGSESRDHVVEFSLNEAEAAAIWTSPSTEKQCENYLLDPNSFSADPVNPAVIALRGRPKVQKNDVILVVDAGGGTTDTATLQVASTKKIEDTQNEVISELKLLAGVGATGAQGVAAGSVQIDEDFEELVRQKLEAIPYDFLPAQNHRALLAKEITSKGFQTHKHNFGSSTDQARKHYSYKVPGLGSDYSDEDAGIKKGKLSFKPREIAALFDKQLIKIFQIMDAELRRSQKITHIVLSGGLGSSHYVQKQILRRYCRGRAQRQLLVAKKPQLAVCIGLAYDKLHRLKYGHAILNEVVCKASYGFLYNEPTHRSWRGASDSSSAQKSHLNGRRYETDRICWLIKKGESLSRETHVSRSFFRMVPYDDVDRTHDSIHWVDTIVMSKSGPGHLPMYFDENETKIVGNIDSRLKSSDFLNPPSDIADSIKIKRRWLRPVKYWQVDLQLQMYPSSTGLQFEVWCNKRRISYTSQIPASIEPVRPRRGQDLLFAENTDGREEEFMDA